MKAIAFFRYGPPEVLQVKEIAKPSPKEDEILIRVHAAEVTKADCELRGFRFAVKWFWLPLRLAMGIRRPRRQVLGGYFAGEVESVGSNVAEFSKGDRVFGSAGIRLGAHAEYLCLPSNYTIVPIPKASSYAEAAAIPLGGLNALHFIRKANLKKGESILINGAGGSIGTFAVQIAKSIGATVTAVDSGIKKQMLRNIGVDHFIDYTKGSATESDQRYDVIFNMVPSQSYTACIKALKDKGRYLMGNPRLIDMLRSLATPLFTSKAVHFAFAGETREELLELSEMIESATLRPVIDKVYEFDHAVDAHKRVETEARQGIVVLMTPHSNARS